LCGCGDGAVKILHIGKYYEPYLGGIENFTYNLYHKLKNDVEIVVLCYNTKHKTEIIHDKGIKVVKVATFGKARSQPLAFGLTKWIEKLGKDADIIHLHFPNPLAEIAVLRARINKRIIVTYHADIVKQKILSKIYSPFMNKILDKSELIIATSPDYAKSSKVLQKYSKKVKIIPLGINFDTTLNKKEVLLIKKKYGKFVLFVGRLIYYKGIEYLIEAFKDINAKLVVIGTGPLEYSLKKRASNNIIFLGRVKNIKDYYSAEEFFVFPSSERTEAFGVVLLEAMSFGKPVICTSLGTGTTFVNIHGKTGLVVKPKDSTALQQAINKLLSSTSLTKRFGEEGRKRVQKYFIIKKIAKEYLKVYHAKYDNKNGIPVVSSI
jgi:rhamnosyl/mannosyltransferase